MSLPRTVCGILYSAFGDRSGMPLVYGSTGMEWRELEGDVNRIFYYVKAIILGQALFAVFFSNHALARQVIAFPQIAESNDTDDILETHPQYLRFVLAVAQGIDSASAERLHKNYQRLLKYDRDGAAHFLKGLRFEMVTKLELMGASPRSIKTTSPEMRRWVSRFVKDWSREADEHLFRVVALRASERNRTRKN